MSVNLRSVWRVAGRRVVLYGALALLAHGVMNHPELCQKLADPTVSVHGPVFASDLQDVATAPALPFYSLAGVYPSGLYDELSSGLKKFSSDELEVCRGWAALEQAFLDHYASASLPGPDLESSPLEPGSPTFGLMSSREIANRLVILLDRHDHEQDRVGHFRLLEALLAFRRDLVGGFARGPTVLGLAVAIAVDRALLKQVVRHLKRVPESGAGCRALSALLARSGDRRAEFRAAFQAEWERWLVAARRNLDDAIRGEGLGRSPTVKRAAQLFREQTRAELEAVVRSERAFLADALSLPAPAARRALLRHRLAFEAGPGQTPSLAAAVMSPATTLTRLLRAQSDQPLYGLVLLNRTLEVETLERGVQICLELLRFQQATGHPPPDLAALERLAGAPLPADPFTGRDFGYTSDDQQFMLFGAGRNGTLDDACGDDVLVWRAGD